MPNINTVFGDEITVNVQPRQMQVSYSGFAGAHGMTGLMHGSRGYVITVRGRLRSQSGLTYNLARVDLIERMEYLEAFMAYPDQTWTYRKESYWYTRVERVVMLPGSDGRIIRYGLDGSAYATFEAVLRSLL